MSPRKHYLSLAGFFAIALSLLLATPVGAQYFGRNKVQYKDFDYKVLETEHFDIYYYAEEEEAVAEAARMAERWYARLSNLFQFELSSRQPLILYASSPDFRQTNVIEGPLGEGTGGVTESLKRRIVLPFAGPIAETDHVLGHELVHAFQYDIVDARRQSGSLSAGRMPLWFIEGMAEYFSLGPEDPHTAMWMRDALAREELPTVRELENPAKYFPYRYGQALLAYIGGRWGDQAVGRMMKEVGPDLPSTIRDVLGIEAEALSRDWHAALEEAYGDLVAELPGPETYGHPLFETTKDDRPLSVGPALSPDGERLAFFSSRDLFSIELYVADAENGEILQRLTKTVSDPHFSSLGFIESSGAWSPDGRRFAFAAVSAGRPHLAIMDVDRNRIEREVPLPDLGEALTPTWSPDGKRIAFSAMQGGVMDLYVYDLETSSLDRRTDDLFAELTPVWSPDGRTIAFVTDRFGAQPDALSMGDYRLALLDVATGEIDLLPGLVGAKHIDPQWSPDGQSLFFISDFNGISNIFRLSLDNGHIEQVTRLLTGVSGIGELSPALSVASASGKMAFGVYQNGGYDIYVTTPGQDPVGSAVVSPVSEASPAMLPPQVRESLVADQLADAETGLPSASASFPSRDYDPGLSLDYVAQPFVVAGADPFGTYLGGGTALVFGDMLGDHQLTTLFQVQGGFEDVAGLVSYRNLSNRWNWGGAFEQVPYVTGSFSTGFANVNGEPAFVEQARIFRQTNTALTGVVSYPFNTFRRVDFSGGVRRVGFSQELRTIAFSQLDGSLLVDDQQQLPSLDTLYLAQTSAAFVGDSSFFGVTSPILGERYRFEVAPYFGDIDFFNAVADYRRYFMPVRPYTIAGRVLHYGRYGSGADDERLTPLFIGYPHLVRGYDFNTFSASECTQTSAGGCPEFERLLGTRMLIANLELRFPLFGAIRGGGALYGPLPVEAAVFADAGVAWEAGDDPTFLGGDRKVVSSIGTALRVNTFGFLIFELDFVKPLDRPLKGWHWMFNLISGF